MKQIIILLFFILNFDIIFSYFGEPISNDEVLVDDKTTHYTREKDMGPCTCDLTNHCDYRCCCDTDCDDDTKNDWNERGICVDFHNNRINDFMCESKKENFNYNKKKATMIVKDHIFNIMCIEFDNSGDMEEYYLDLEKQKLDDSQANDWIESFFPHIDNSGTRNLQDDGTYKYGQKFDEFPSFSRNILNCCTCMPKDIFYLKPFESKCKIINDIEIDEYKNKENYKIYGDNENVKEITCVLYYDSNNHITKEIVKILTSENKQNSIKYKVEWKNANTIKRAIPYGYQQGKPIKIMQNEEKEYYENGYFIVMSNNDGYCTETNEINKAVNIYSILFKNNVKYSCKIKKNFKDTYIYSEFCNNYLRIGKAPNSSLDNSNEWISLKDQIKCEDFLDKDINITLIILTSKEGKENSPYEIIKHAKFNLKDKEKAGNNGILSFSIKFLDISYSSIIKSKNGIISSFTSSFLNDL